MRLPVFSVTLYNFWPYIATFVVISVLKPAGDEGSSILYHCDLCVTGKTNPSFLPIIYQWQVLGFVGCGRFVVKYRENTFSSSSHLISETPKSILLFLKTYIVEWLGVWFLIWLFVLGNGRFADAEWRAEIHDPAGGKADKAKQSYRSVRKHH